MYTSCTHHGGMHTSMWICSLNASILIDNNIRVCEECQVVEDECHVIMHCTLYTDIRDQLFIEICDITSHFQTLTPDDQFLMIMSDPQYYRCASRAMCNILNRRRCTMLQ